MSFSSALFVVLTSSITVKTVRYSDGSELDEAAKNSVLPI
jgi:hypothetical protein